MTEPAIIKLEDPITNEAGEEIAEITLRPPNLGDRQFLDGLGLNADPAGKVDLDKWATTAYEAVQKLGDVAPATAKKISAGDAMKIYSGVMVFIGGSQMNGQTSFPS